MNDPEMSRDCSFAPMKIATRCLLFACLLMLSACTDAEKALANNLHKKNRVTVYDGGKVVGEWVSTGQVQNEAHSDGYFFLDAESHHLIRVSGTVVIEETDPDAPR